MAGLIRRNSIPKTVKTSALAERWNVSDETVRRICKRHGIKRVQPGGARNSPIQWVFADVERFERSAYGAVL